MSDSSSDHRSSEEENTNTAQSSSPLGQIHYHPFRQSPWTSGRFDMTRRTFQRDSPGEGVPTQTPTLDRGVGSRPFSTLDIHPPPQPPFSSPPRPDLSPMFPPQGNRSAPDQSLLLGTRPEDIQGNPERLSGSYPGYERDNSSNASETGSTPTFIYQGPGSRRPRHHYNQDEFDGPAQWLPLPLPQQEQIRAQALPPLPVNLSIPEQDEIARQVNDVLSHCAFHFVAKYQFPIPIEREKPVVRQPADREWTEWAYLLKRLATKRRIPARVLYQGQIKQLVTTLENAIAVRQTVNTRNDAPMPRQPRDDRYMLQLVSSGLQVARILMDSVAMEQLNQLYTQTEAVISERRSRISTSQSAVGTGRIARGGRGSGGRGSGGGGNVGGAGGGGGGGGGGAGSMEVGVVY